MRRHGIPNAATSSIERPARLRPLAVLVTVLAAVLGLCAVTAAAGARPVRTPLAAEATPTFAAYDVPASPGFAGSPSITTAACPAKGVCAAGGDVFQLFGAPNSRPVLDVLAGGAWRNVATPAMPDLYDGSVADVACPSATYCAALVTSTYYGTEPTGTGDGPTWLVQLTGPALSTVSTRQLAAGGAYFGLTCPAAGSCVLAGRTTDTGLPRFATLTGDAITYAAGSLPRGINGPTPPGAPLACPSTSWCAYAPTAFTGDDLGAPVLGTLVNGRWRSRVAPAPPGSTGITRVTELVCPTAGSCTGYGDATVDGAQQPVQFTLAKGRWTVARLALPADAVVDPNAGVAPVSCAAPIECAGVTNDVDSTTGGSRGELLYSQDGSIQVAHIGTADYQYSRLTDVDCPVAGGCLAIGYRVRTSSSGPTSQAIAALRFGTSVRTFDLPDAPTPAGYGTSGGTVACAPTADFCLAVPRNQDYRNYESYFVTVS